MWGGGWECGESVLATESRGSMHRSQTDHGTLLVWPSRKTEAVRLVESLTHRLKKIKPLNWQLTNLEDKVGISTSQTVSTLSKTDVIAIFGN